MKRAREQEGESVSDEELLDLVSSAQEVDVPDVAFVRRSVLDLEKQITLNQEQRFRYPDEPMRFAESELTLNSAIRKLQIISSLPQLFEEFVALNAIVSLLSLLEHPNTDIVISVLELLQEFTEPDSYMDYPQAIVLIQQLKSKNFHVLLMKACHSLDNVLSTLTYQDDINDVVNGMNCILNVFENITDIDSEFATVLGNETSLFEFILNRIGKKSSYSPFNSYCSELLSILAQKSEINREKIGSMDGIFKLLTAISNYRGNFPKSEQEEEYVLNIFDTLCNLVLSQENKTRFDEADGIDLLLMMIKKKGFCYVSAFKLLDFHFQRNPKACLLFINKFGLKYLFASFMRKHKINIEEEKNHDEHIISIIYWLFTAITENVSKDSSQLERLVSKFSELSFQKCDRLVEMYLYYSKILNALESEHAEAADGDEDTLYLRRLDSGLSIMQTICLIYCHLFKMNARIKEHLLELFRMHSIQLNTLAEILKEYQQNYGENENEKNQLQKLIVHLIQ